MAVSYVLIPLSHNITFSFPLDKMYSLASNNSSNVADIPRFNKTGSSDSPTASRSLKFCMFLAPICRTSTYFSIIDKCCASIISLKRGNEVISEASFSIFNPSSPNPWKLYGEVLGLNAPPLKPFDPASFAAIAVSIVCSCVSALSGPAIIAISSPPMVRFCI